MDPMGLAYDLCSISLIPGLKKKNSTFCAGGVEDISIILADAFPTTTLWGVILIYRMHVWYIYLHLVSLYIIYLPYMDPMG